jgi:integrating conjugative element membrane protein (TIGR03747 family)
MSQTEHLDRDKQVKKKQSLTFDTIGALVDLLFLLVGALIFSIAAEWIGMSIIWPDEGVEHSSRMMLTELEYINRDFRTSVLGSTPMEYAIESASWIDTWLFEKTYFRDVLSWAISPSQDAGWVRIQLAGIVRLIQDYIEAAINVTQLFGIRMAIAALSMPAFILIGVAAMIDGLVDRDLRRFTGSNESSFIYHKAKPWIKPAIIGAWFIYLGMPVALHPNVIFVPASVLFGLAIFITFSTFKKTL